LSAIGIVAADVVQDQSRTVMLEVNSRTARKLNVVFREMEAAARATLRREGFAAASQRHEQLLAMRYTGQSFELEIANSHKDLAAAFHRAHRARYGYARPNNAVEVVSARLRSLGLVQKLKVRRSKILRGGFVAKPVEFAEIYLGGKQVRAGIYQREDLPPGSRLRAPCIVAEYSATTLVPGGVRAKVDEFGNLLIDL